MLQSQVLHIHLVSRPVSDRWDGDHTCDQLLKSNGFFIGVPNSSIMLFGT